VSGAKPLLGRCIRDVLAGMQVLMISLSGPGRLDSNREWFVPHVFKQFMSGLAGQELVMTLFSLLQFAVCAAVLTYVVPKVTSNSVSTYGSFANGCIATFVIGFIYQIAFYLFNSLPLYQIMGNNIYAWSWLIKLALLAVSILTFGRLFGGVLYVRSFGGAFIAAIALVVTMMLLPAVVAV